MTNMLNALSAVRGLWAAFAVVFAVSFLLAGCGGDGGGGLLNIIPGLNNYVAVAAPAGSGYRGAFIIVRGSAAEAERNAVNECEQHNSDCEVVLEGHTGCAAVARSERPGGNGRSAAGFATSSTRAGAQTAAIAQCERGASGSSAAGTCRVATGGNGSPLSLCAN